MISGKDSSTITEFDFLNYVFGRQVNLLLALNSPDEAAKHAFHYVPYMVNRMEIQLLNKGVTGPQSPPPAADPMLFWKNQIASTPKKSNYGTEFEEISIQKDDKDLSDTLRTTEDNGTDSSAVAVNSNAQDTQSLNGVSNSLTDQVQPSIELQKERLKQDLTEQQQQQILPIQSHSYFDFSKFEVRDFQRFIFIHVWGFCASMSIVEACQKKAFDTDSETLKQLCKILGDLYSFAQFQLHLVCKLFGLSIFWEHFRFSENTARVAPIMPIIAENKEKLLSFSSNYEGLFAMCCLSNHVKLLIV
jgi:hypothetical protein